MSLSKDPPLPAQDQPRRPKCARCRHHGLLVPKKGHSRRCAFLSCACWKCLLISQRTRVTAEQRSLNKAQNPKEGHEVRVRVRDGPRPQADTSLERAAATAWSTPHLHVEEEKTPFDAPCLGAGTQTAPLPVLSFPWMPGFPNVQWLPPVHAGIYSSTSGLCGPPTFPQFGAVHYPNTAEPGPPADCRLVIFSLQPTSDLQELQPRPPLD